MGYDAYGRPASKLGVTNAGGTQLFADTVERAPTDAVIALGNPTAQSFTYDAVGR